MFTISNYSGFTLLQIDVLKQSYFSGWRLGFENFFQQHTCGFYTIL